MPHVWIRNDFKHHLKIKLSQDKIVFDKQKKKNALGLEGNVDIGVEPINVGVGAVFNKKTEVEQEGIVFQDIQVAGFTRVEKGTEHTFAYNFDKKKLHYMTILIHTGDGNFERKMVNQELENKNKNIRINDVGAIVNANWTNWLFGSGKRVYLDAPTSEHKPVDKENDLAFDMYMNTLEKLCKRMNPQTVNADLLEGAIKDLNGKWEILTLAHSNFVTSGFRKSKPSMLGGYEYTKLSSEDGKEYLDKWTNLEINHEDKMMEAKKILTGLKVSYPQIAQVKRRKAEALSVYKEALFYWKEAKNEYEKMELLKDMVGKFEDLEMAHQAFIEKENVDWNATVEEFKDIFDISETEVKIKI